MLRSLAEPCDPKGQKLASRPASRRHSGFTLGGWSTASAVQLRFENDPASAAEVTETLPQALSLASPFRSRPIGVLHKTWSLRLGRFSATAPADRGLVNTAGSGLVEPKVHLDVDLHRDRSAVFHRGLELPVADRLNRLLVEAHSQGPGDPDVTRLAIGTDDQP